ncbi:MAG: hypothetical protein ACU0CO_14760 [Shimia sp.]
MTTHRLAPLLAALALSGCAFADFEQVAAVADLSPVTVNPADVTIFLRLPPTLGVVPGSANVTLGAERSDTGEREFVTYPLESRDQGTLTGYRIAEAEWPRFRAQQDRIAAWQAEAPRATRGSFAVDATPCTRPPGPSAGDTASVLLRTTAGAVPQPLISDAPLSSVFSASDIALFEAC